MTDFTSLGLPADFWPLLDENQIIEPTPIQSKSIPVILEGSDIIGIAQTGTGKTLAFGLPLLARLKANELGRILVLAPTRELATQIGQSLRPFSGPSKISLTVLVGGAPMMPQSADLRRQPRIVVATPGRLLDHMMKGNLRLREFDAVVLDEADRMLDMGFMPAIKKILSLVPNHRQTLLFSATMPEAIAELTEEFMNDPQRVEVAPQGTPVELIEQAAYIVKHDDKGDLLHTMLEETTGPVLVFARTRHGARKVSKALVERGHRSVEIHADRTQNQRDAAMAGFRSGKHRVLVATDIAARGIDVKNIELVVQYDLPDCHEDYVHRIGRTGRAGANGRAVVMVTPDSTGKLTAMERTIGFAIPTSPDSPLTRPAGKGRGPQVSKAPLRSQRAPSAPEWFDNPKPSQFGAARQKPKSERPVREARPYSDGHRRDEVQDRPYRADRPARPYGEDFRRDNRPARPHSEGYRRDDRPSVEGYRRDDRPARPHSEGYRRDDRPSGEGYWRDDRAARPHSEGYRRDDRPARPYGQSFRRDDRSSGEGYRRDDRPSRPQEEGYRRDDRPARPYNDGYRRDDRPARPQGEGYRRDDRPARPYNDGYRRDDRPASPSSEGRKPWGPKPSGSKPHNPAGKFDGPKPKKDKRMQAKKGGKPAFASGAKKNKSSQKFAKTWRKTIG